MIQKSSTLNQSEFVSLVLIPDSRECSLDDPVIVDPLLDPIEYDARKPRTVAPSLSEKFCIEVRGNVEARRRTSCA